MKKLFLLVVYVMLLFSCTQQSNNHIDEIFQEKWMLGDRVLIDEGNYHSRTHYDIELKKMIGDTIYPIIFLDSSIVVKENVAWGKYNDNFEFNFEKDTSYVDTLNFSIKNYNGSKLILYKHLNSPIILKLENPKFFDEIYRIETTPFEIGGFSIGDTIERELLEFGEVENKLNYTIENTKLKSNKNIRLDIIGNNIIYQITQMGITDSESKNIIKVITDKLEVEPNYREPYSETDFRKESYTWSENGVYISFTRMEYEGKYSSHILSQLNGWILYYSDNLLQKLLESEYSGSEPKSSIIR